MSFDRYYPGHYFWYSSQITGLIFTLAIISFCFILYYVKLKKYKSFEVPKGYVFVMQIYFSFINNMVLQILGKKFEKITPFFIYLFSYILICNSISILGIANPTSSLTITLSLGFVTFIGIFVVGFKYQKLSFLKKYTFNVKVKNHTIPLMINPLNIVSQFAPLISISFRLWGNIFAGTIIVTLVLASTNELTNHFLFWDMFDILGAILLIPLHMYFDLLSGFIQAFVFLLLTMVYWKLEAKEPEIAQNLPTPILIK